MYLLSRSSVRLSACYDVLVKHGHQQADFCNHAKTKCERFEKFKKDVRFAYDLKNMTNTKHCQAVSKIFTINEYLMYLPFLAFCFFSFIASCLLISL